MKKTISVLVAVAISISLFSAEFHSIADGNFENPAIWDLGTVPTSSDQIYVDHELTLSNDLTLNNGGELYIGEGQSLTVNDLNGNNFTYIEVLGNLSVNDLRTARWASYYIGPNAVVIAANWDNFSTLLTNAIDGAVVVSGTFNNHVFGSIIWGSGSITAGHFEGSGWTFGWVNSTIPDGSTVHSDGTLPIELSSFTAETKNTEVIINWSTATELNNNYFTIERSVDGEIFEEIGVVMGAGTSNVVNEYSIIDENPPSGLVYYRLKQTDFNGEFKIFGSVPVKVNIADKSIYYIAQNNLQISNPNTPYNIDIYSINGKKIFSQRNVEQQIKQINLSSGFYIVTINNSTSKKIIMP